MDQYYYDKNGYPVSCGDILRVFHFTGPRNKKFYMWKVAMEVPLRRRGMIAVCIKELAIKGVNNAHYCDMAALGNFEIVDGSGGFGLPDWEDFRRRPKRLIHEKQIEGER